MLRYWCSKALTNPVLQGVLCPLLSLKYVRDPWCGFWRLEIDSVDSEIFQKRSEIFASHIQSEIHIAFPILLFYDSLRSNRTSDVLPPLKGKNIYMIALPTHTSHKTATSRCFSLSTLKKACERQFTEPTRGK